jgi:aminomuconate-semialdehyde/2-hydroxymuconate-6-semialdehyde dehydrogenase
MQVTPYPFRGKTLPCYVDGEFVTGGKSFDNVSPIDGVKLAPVAEADRALVDRAVAAARTALSGRWGEMSQRERLGLLHKVADGIRARFDDFVAAEIADTGKTYLQASQTDIPRGAANFSIFADLALSRSSDCFEMDTADGLGALNYSVHKPLGVVAVISPWNLPLLLLSWKVAPALACGNTVVVKPSEETPSTATLMAEVFDRAGVPPGVFNLVHGFGENSTGEFMVSHPGIDAITFTGESATGSAIMKNAAAGLKPVSFELGGKNAALIFADCDFEAALNGTVRSVFSNSGQVCLCSERVYVERPIFEKFSAALAERAKAITVGSPYEDADMGPVISHKHRDKVLSYYRLAEQEGGRFLAGGGVPKFGDQRDQGAYVEPSVIAGLSEQARCVKEEIFGPVCHIAPFDSEEQALHMANDTNYGLAAAVWTNDLKRAHRVARRLEVGVVWVNDWFLRDLRTPFGGVKLSGIGREGGMHSLAFYSETSNICIKG